MAEGGGRRKERASFLTWPLLGDVLYLLVLRHLASQSQGPKDPKGRGKASPLRQSLGPFSWVLPSLD